jgi:hypothetical protein
MSKALEEKLRTLESRLLNQNTWSSTLSNQTNANANSASSSPSTGDRTAATSSNTSTGPTAPISSTASGLGDNTPPPNANSGTTSGQTPPAILSNSTNTGQIIPPGRTSPMPPDDQTNSIPHVVNPDPNTSTSSSSKTSGRLGRAYKPGQGKRRRRTVVTANDETARNNSDCSEDEGREIEGEPRQRALVSIIQFARHSAYSR